MSIIDTPVDGTIDESTDPVVDVFISKLDMNKPPLASDRSAMLNQRMSLIIGFLIGIPVALWLTYGVLFVVGNSLQSLQKCALGCAIGTTILAAFVVPMLCCLRQKPQKRECSNR
jgi:hypothetical protein